jgi:3'-phosphoadenosine 5'-phosphosulfate sulfotransferase (PAPS reductase)/FAD synthetase
MKPEEIIKKAIQDYKPIHALLLFSGGHDSMVSTHLAASILDKIGFNYTVYHGDTSICIKETRDYLKTQCKTYGWKLEIRSPKEGETYKDIVQKYGFPGPTPIAHGIMYRRLKERALRRFISHEIKSKPQARENVILISGVRKAESKIRMGYKDAVKKEGSKIWTAPCFGFQKSDIENYLKDHNIKRNIVKDTIGISGECLCGCFSDKGEYDKICQHFPQAADQIDQLHDLAIENGKHWHWTQGPTEWEKLYPKDQMCLDLGMCSNCSRIS